jgi:hypothetical protein
MSEFRPPNENTILTLRRLLSAEFPGNTALIAQLPHIEVRNIDAEGSLEIRVTEDNKACVHSTVPVEASYSDTGNSDPFAPRVRILLHVRNGLMHELEFFKDDGSRILREPSDGELQVEVNCPST